jgi:DeoR/GlpR family transcriptional regulator of sugar metabolism
MTNMSEPAELRRQRILAIARSNEYVRPNDLAAELAVSGETIRRDLQVLERIGKIRRLHGGVVLETELRAFEPTRESRTKASRAEKTEIALLAVGLLRSNSAVFLDVGTTVETVASNLSPEFEGTIITTSLAIGSILGESTNTNVQILGGALRPGEFTTFGPDTIAQIENFNTDFAFISAGGVHPQNGLTDYSSEDVASRLAMIKNADATYLLVTSEKLNKTALRHVCQLTALRGIITDRHVTKDQITTFQDAGVDVLHPIAN